MADFGYVCWAAPPDGLERMAYYEGVLGSLPP
jgi:hypothetical protein